VVNRRVPFLLFAKFSLFAAPTFFLLYPRQAEATGNPEEDDTFRVAGVQAVIIGSQLEETVITCAYMDIGLFMYMYTHMCL
jgi:hypothetical protein